MQLVPPNRFILANFNQLKQTEVSGLKFSENIMLLTKGCFMLHRGARLKSKTCTEKTLEVPNSSFLLGRTLKFGIVLGHDLGSSRNAGSAGILSNTEKSME